MLLRAVLGALTVVRPLLAAPDHASNELSAASAVDDSGVATQLSARRRRSAKERRRRLHKAQSRAVAPDSHAASYQLVRMTDKGLDGMGAVCLDGSDATFWFQPASASEANASWQIYFAGGGWCVSEGDCRRRSSTWQGSSINASEPLKNAPGGMMSGSCEDNPTFCHFNRVFVSYCDGASYAGDVEEPRTANGTASPVYYRGKRIVDAVIQTLVADFGLGSATEVLLTGDSAGGMAVYLMADRVHAQLESAAPRLRKYRVAPMSGMFLKHSNFDGDPVFPDSMKSIFEFTNARSSVSSDCVASRPAESQWECFLPQVAYAHMTSRIFVLNSAFDMYQAECIYGARLDRNSSNGLYSCGEPRTGSWCLKHPALGTPCSDAEIRSVNQYIDDFEGTLQRSPANATYLRAGNGAYVHSCHTHSEMQSTRAWLNLRHQGVSPWEAVRKWWDEDAPQPAESNTYASPCRYHVGSLPHRCNPTCAWADSDGYMRS